MTNPKITLTTGINPKENAVGSFLISLDSPAPVGGLVVNFTTSGSATINTDYTLTTGTNLTAVTTTSFTIAAGQTSATLNLNALADNVKEGNETVVLSLANGTGYTLPPLKFDKVDYATGSSPYSVASGDFNNDGKTDLAVANSSDNTVSVLLRNATNTGFDSKVDIATGRSPISVSTGDFNGDAKLDLAVANFSDNTVSVLLRNSANTGFDNKLDIATGSNAFSVSTGDFNGDGKLDLAVANDNNNTVSVILRNTANTGFNVKTDYSTGSIPQSVRAGDFNNDGKLDLVVANQGSNTVSVILRNATNTGFDAKTDIATGSNAFSVSTGDFNNDGKLDLAVTNLGNDTVSVILRNSANTGFDNKVDIATGSLPYSVSTGDFNNDGKTDLAVTSYVDNNISVLMNNSVYANASLTIADVPNHLPTGKVTISDSKPAVGEVLTALNTLKDADGLGVVSYSWLVSNKSVATGDNYTVATSDLGKAIKVVTNYTDALGHTESVSSANTSKVILPSLINGTADSDLLSGSLGNDLINGLAGNDLIDGDNGNDILNGGDGDDLIHGGAGNDIINGGLGSDVLNGGTGKDTFVFDSALISNVDKIMDFKVVDDTIQLDNAIFAQLTKTGVLSADNFVISNAANDANDFIIYNKTSGGLFYDADANGANNPVQIATLGVNLTMTNADFVVI